MSQYVSQDTSTDDISSSSQVISEHLVSFRNIEELQHQNQKLLAVVRELSEEKEQRDTECVLEHTKVSFGMGRRGSVGVGRRGSVGVGRRGSVGVGRRVVLGWGGGVVLGWGGESTVRWEERVVLGWGGGSTLP